LDAVVAFHIDSSFSHWAFDISRLACRSLWRALVEKFTPRSYFEHDEIVASAILKSAKDSVRYPPAQLRFMAIPSEVEIRMLAPSIRHLRQASILA
jgi:hypothetical protein